VGPAVLDLLATLEYIERSRFFTMRGAGLAPTEAPLGDLDDGIRLIPRSPREERINQLELIGFA